MSEFSADDFSLPSWAYTDPEFLALERERVFRPSWQVICHVSEIPNPGDYQCFDFIGEMLFAMRGNDGAVRVFHNVCRHRASRLLDGPRGHCTRRIVCPYHAWSYDLEGRLASVGDRSAFPHLDIARESLVPVETEIYAGFVFARVQGGGPTRRADDGALRRRNRHARVRKARAHRPRDAAAAQGELEERRRQLLRCACTSRWRIPASRGCLAPAIASSRASGWTACRESSATSRRATGPERMYQKYLPDRRASAADKRRSWVYFKLWPNFAFDVYPDQVDIMQWLPVSPTEMPDPRDRLCAARRPARDARGALLQLAHQSPGERRRPRAHRARAERHGVGQLPRRPAGRRAKWRCAASASACAR